MAFTKITDNVAAYLKNLRASAAGGKEHPRNVKGLSETK